MMKLSKEQIIMMHSQLIEQTGGIDGIRDEGLLESAISAPFQSYDNEELYPTILSSKPFSLVLGVFLHFPFFSLIIYLSNSLILLINEYCRKTGLTIREVVEVALVEYFSKYGFEREIDHILNR